MVSRAMRDFNERVTSHESRVTEILVHTGQHYDYQMSQVFFDQLDLPEPHYHLEIGSGSHGDQTGRMLAAIEKVLLDEKPDAVLVYGDTNSTLAGALAAAKLHIPVGHVEGGMRSFNRRMPEEINRVLTDHIASWHFCPTETAIKNLKNEGITKGVHLVGDVMFDAVMTYKEMANKKSDIFEHLGLSGCHVEQDGKVSDTSCRNDNGRVTGPGSRIPNFALVTIHRAENTDEPTRLRNILEALSEISKEMPVVLPLHPRTRKMIDVAGLNDVILSRQAKNPVLSSPLPPVGEGQGEGDNVAGLAGISRVAGIIVTEPLSYLDMLRLEESATIILTDSGGMQKEAFWLGVPCVTMRDETEWVETVEAGWNKVAGADKNSILRAFTEFMNSTQSAQKDCVNFNKGLASKKIVDCLTSGVAY